MGWPMGWDGMGSKTGSKRRPRMTYAGPIQEPPGAARRSHPGLSRQRQAITYGPAGPYPYASIYMAVALAPAAPMPTPSPMPLRHASKLYGPRTATLGQPSRSHG